MNGDVEYVKVRVVESLLSILLKPANSRYELPSVRPLTPTALAESLIITILNIQFCCRQFSLTVAVIFIAVPAELCFQTDCKPGTQRQSFHNNRAQTPWNGVESHR